MRKLLIVDPTLLSLEGHSYNYDLAISRAAQARFDEVVVYADRAFRDPCGRLATCRPVLNRLRLDTLKRWANAAFHVIGKKKPADPAHSTIVPGVWTWMIRLAKWLRAKDLEWSLRTILRGQRDDETHVLIQHAHFSELALAERMRAGAQLHLVLRYSPELVFPERKDPRGLLARLGPNVHLYTDSERLSAEYSALGAKNVRTLPVPIVVPEHAAAPDDGIVRVAFLGTSRVEKGFCELPSLIEQLPREGGVRRVAAMVQVSLDSADPRIREAIRKLQALSLRLPAGTLELLQSPVPIETYYAWLARAAIVALPYLSKKYNASTSGIFVEAVCFGAPVICPAESWMADVVAEAACDMKLRIGEVVASIDEIPAATARIAAALPDYRAAVREFAVRWRETHNADECVRIMFEAVR